MGKILDLSCFQEETLDITMPDKRVIHVKKPTEELYIKIIAFQERVKKADKKDAFSAVNDMAGLILSHNTQGRDNCELAKKLPDAMKFAIIQAFTEFITETASDPNCKSRSNQGQNSLTGMSN